jgi:hypothetical protein
MSKDPTEEARPNPKRAMPRPSGLTNLNHTAFGDDDLGWIRKHAPEDGSVTVSDVTSSRAGANLFSVIAALTRRGIQVDAQPLPAGGVHEQLVGGPKRGDRHGGLAAAGA